LPFLIPLLVEICNLYLLTGIFDSIFLVINHEFAIRLPIILSGLWIENPTQQVSHNLIFHFYLLINYNCKICLPQDGANFYLLLVLGGLVDGLPAPVAGIELGGGVDGKPLV